MKQEEIIKQLKQLHKIEPKPDTIAQIKSNIYHNLQIPKPSTFQFKANSFMVYGLAIAFAIFVFLSIRIATSQNQFEKASIALSYAQGKINTVIVASNKLNENKIKDISQSIALANGELSKLKLMGEKGRYTSEQCEELYRSYHASLEKLDNNITTSSTNDADKQSIAPLKTQISNYEKQAEQKLKLY